MKPLISLGNAKINTMLFFISIHKLNIPFMPQTFEKKETIVNCGWILYLFFINMFKKDNTPLHTYLGLLLCTLQKLTDGFYYGNAKTVLLSCWVSLNIYVLHLERMKTLLILTTVVPWPSLTEFNLHHDRACNWICLSIK